MRWNSPDRASRNSSALPAVRDTARRRCGPAQTERRCSWRHRTPAHSAGTPHKTGGTGGRDSPGCGDTAGGRSARSVPGWRLAMSPMAVCSRQPPRPALGAPGRTRTCDARFRNLAGRVSSGSSGAKTLVRAPHLLKGFSSCTTGSVAQTGNWMGNSTSYDARCLRPSVTDLPL